MIEIVLQGLQHLGVQYFRDRTRSLQIELSENDRENLTLFMPAHQVGFSGRLADG